MKPSLSTKHLKPAAMKRGVRDRPRKSRAITMSRKMRPGTYTIIGMLFDPRPTFTEISEKTGVSRQRVEYIANQCKLNGVPIPERGPLRLGEGKIGDQVGLSQAAQLKLLLQKGN